jgi:aryl-alcohol dehydrogenase-like predicted oxidoreductase
VQFNYSVASRGAEQRLLPLAAERGVAVLVNLPFGGGRVLRSLRQRPLPGWAAEIGCQDWNQLLLKFVLSQPAVTCVIPGTSDPAHMRANAAAGSGVLPEPAFWKSRLADLTA